MGVCPVRWLMVVEGPESLASRCPALVVGCGGGRRVGVARENVETPNVSASLRGVENALLGPERTTTGSSLSGVGPVVVFLVVRSFGLLVSVGVGGLVVRVVVENCTVDASIFCFCSVLLCRDFLMCVLVKLSRAHGGCLGIRSR